MYGVLSVLLSYVYCFAIERSDVREQTCQLHVYTDYIFIIYLQLHWTYP